MYIFWFLHQTTTVFDFVIIFLCCISFDSYIKPQLSSGQTLSRWVVYLLIPTSNHNLAVLVLKHILLYIFWFLHQTTTQALACKNHRRLYIFWFLHQTTTVLSKNKVIFRCISFDSYIKPQPKQRSDMLVCVVYLLIPTSNHNLLSFGFCCLSVVYLLIPTSNHNWVNINHRRSTVVYLLIPTSNHNLQLVWAIYRELYIFWFLHQTTTKRSPSLHLRRCISFDSYIKPQPSTRMSWQEICCISFDSYIKPQLMVMLCVFLIVVYLLIPTSNHNLVKDSDILAVLYIFWFLHQTTTYFGMMIYENTLYIFWFLHQTTT